MHVPRLVHMLLHLCTCSPTCVHVPTLVHMLPDMCACSYTCAHAPRHVCIFLDLCTCSYTYAHAPTVMHMLPDMCACSNTCAHAPTLVHMLLHFAHAPRYVCMFLTCAHAPTLVRMLLQLYSRQLLRDGGLSPGLAGCMLGVSSFGRWVTKMRFVSIFKKKKKMVSSIGNGGSDAVFQTAPEKAATPYTTMIFSSSAAQEITK